MKRLYIVIVMLIFVVSASSFAATTFRYVQTFVLTGNSGAPVYPMDVAVDSAGKIYVVDGNYINDQYSNRVIKYKPLQNGLRIEKEWGQFGAGDGEFDWPINIAVGPNDTIFEEITY